MSKYSLIGDVSKKRVIVVRIERGNDVNSAMFDMLSCIQTDATDLNEAQTMLQARFGAEHSLYWFYRGGNHIAVQSHNHKQRVAILTLN